MSGKKKDFKITPIEEENPEAFGMQPASLSMGKGEVNEQPDITVHGLDDDLDDDLEDEVEPIRPSDLRAVDSGKIAITFDKFIQLLTAHDFEEAMKGHKKKEIIIDVDLLADLATVPEEEEAPRRIPLYFALGLFIGAAVVFVLVKLIT